MNLRNLEPKNKDEDNNIETLNNITYPPGHDNSIDLPEDPSYTVPIIIGTSVVFSCLGYFITARLCLGENLILECLFPKEYPEQDLSGVQQTADDIL